MRNRNWNHYVAACINPRIILNINRGPGNRGPFEMANLKYVNEYQRQSMREMNNNRVCADYEYARGRIIARIEIAPTVNKLII